MIFVTIGTQIPFDRFIEIIDDLAGTIDESFVVQALNGNYTPKNFKPVDFITPDEFDKIISEARLVVAHAGIGSILSAIDYEKPVIIFPRLASLGEHRNDHQMATAKTIHEKGYAYVAYNKEQLTQLILTPDLQPLKKNIKQTSNNILSSIINKL